MKELLPLFKQPSHYLGNEINSVHKNPQEVSLRFGLAFPDHYDVGMSYLGQKILYSILNHRQDIWAERVFAPSLQVADILREYQSELCTLESDTPLKKLDVLGFSLTHELCYTTFLYMLDIANIPKKAKDRGENFPFVAAGGSVFNPEPITEFFDFFVLGDGEEIILEVSDIILKAKEANSSKLQILEELASLRGVYVPCIFDRDNEYYSVEKRVLEDLDSSEFPTQCIVPFGKPVHDRFTLEIARGCTRGCRFCQAGATERPVRERSLQKLDKLVSHGLENTGYEEISFLSLSPGDFSGLEHLFQQSFEQCKSKQVAISLPSLRAGSLNPALMSMLSSIKKTGATIAPEAGTERLRKVINKGISEQELLEHTHKLFELGWNNIKLYFMIGLPTETWEDIQAIYELSKRVLETALNRKRVNVSTSISPFVPKPQTPFQWEEQNSLDLIQEKIQYLKKLFKSRKRLTLKWQDPWMSFLECVLSRGERKLAHTLEIAYSMGDVFSSWQECFDIAIWEKAFQDSDLDPKQYTQKIDPERELPWEHLNTGVTKKFLLRERRRSREERPSPDCRYHPCLECGVCNLNNKHSALRGQDSQKDIRPRLNLDKRDQTLEDFNEQELAKFDLNQKEQRLKIWFSKQGPAKYLSQLELQGFLERAMRRAKLPISFSRGFHPKPLLSFGRALPVGIASIAEWCEVYLEKVLECSQILNSLNSQSISGMKFWEAKELNLSSPRELSQIEEFELCLLSALNSPDALLKRWEESLNQQHLTVEKKSKKGSKNIDVRPFISEVFGNNSNSIRIVLDWRLGYINPLYIVSAVHPELNMQDLEICKINQYSHPGL